MKKKIIASLLTLGACAALVSNANINTVNAATTGVATTVSKSYYFDFTGDLSNITGTRGLEGEKLNDGTGLILTIRNNDSESLSKSITTKSIKDDSEKTITSALKINANQTLSFNATGTWTAIINYGSEASSSVDFKVTVGETSSTTTKQTVETNKLYTTKLEGASGNVSIARDTNNLYIAEMIITIQEEKSVSASAYVQTGSKSQDGNVLYYFRFITIVDETKSIIDLENAQYVLTYTDTKNVDHSATVTPNIVDKIEKTYTTDDGKKVSETYSSLITYHNVDKTYSFDSSTEKYLVYTIAYASKNATTNEFNYQYTGTVKLSVVLNGKEIASKGVEFNDAKE